MKLNPNFRHLAPNYLFREVATVANAYQKQHPERELIKLSIGDVTCPLAGVVVSAMRTAVTELGKVATFRGYGPECGYSFLREALANDYAVRRGAKVDADSIFISDGAKSDLSALPDLFAPGCRVAVVDPGYPVLKESSLLAGCRVQPLPAIIANNFLPLPYQGLKADVVYLCHPGNPTGACYSRAMLKQWVDWANRHRAVIVFDVAYESFISDPDVPRSIYQIPGAETCAVEIGSFSKSAGFTGLRCGYTIVPATLRVGGVSWQERWQRRQSVKFNGASYPVQRGATASLTAEGLLATQKNVAYYLRNVRLLADVCRRLGWTFAGGEQSPYLWVQCPNGWSSGEFFQQLLEQAGIISTPGVGFGACGEGYIRLTGFNTYTATKQAVARLWATFGEQQ